MLLLIFGFNGLAQQTDIEMADQFRADGKIYVVISVVLLILVGLFVYLISFGKKISKLEKEISKKA
jgi:uncharacterized membrane protein